MTCSLAACGRTESNEQQAKAMEKFEAAWELQEQAVSGVVYERDRLAEDDEGNVSLEGTIEEYRQEKQESAAGQAQQIGGGLQPGQTAARNLIIGQSQASKARKLARDASLAWTGQGDLHTKLINTASGIALSANLAEQYGKVDFQEQIADAQAALDEHKQRQQEFAAAVQSSQDKIKALEGELKDLVASSREKAAAAEELSRKAFTAKGQAQYDLYVMSAKATNEADDLTAQADNLRVQLDLARSQLKIKQTQLESAQGRVTSIGQALAALQTRLADTRKLAEDAAARAEALTTEQFQPGFEELIGGYAEQVVKPFDEAVETMNQSLESAESAAASAPSESRNDLELHTVGLRLAFGTLLRQRLLAEIGYRDLLKTLHEGMNTARPQLAEPVAQAFTTSEQRIATIVQQGQESLNKALEDLAPLTEGQGEQQRLPLRYLVQTYQTLAAITGKGEYNTLAEQTRQRIGQIGRQAEQ